MLSRLDLYLGDIKESYKNTDREQELLPKFVALYNNAKNAQERCEFASPENLDKWRRAYLGTLNALTQEGVESKRKSRQLRKVAYEIVESTIDNSIPMPKMQARYKDDLHLISVTENYLKYEMERILTKFNNDKAERATYVDGTGWYKVWWDSLDNKHERSGNVKVEFCQVDQIIPQPGVKDYKQMEYIFERQKVSISRIYDVYNRCVTPNDGEMVDIINCYYLNNNRIVGLFSWCELSGQVICDEEDWQIRKVRKCETCGTINPTGSSCSFCGSKKIKYKNADKEILSEPLVRVYNPYEVGETDNPEMNRFEAKEFLNAGDEIPFYQLRQLPFVPRPAVSTSDTIYGISEVRIVLEMQDGVNKTLSKAIEKTLKSGTVVTKPERMKINSTDDTFKIFGVRSAEEATMVQAKQILADVSQDVNMAAILYDSAKSSSGITDSFQGKSDSTATSGKAKQYAAMQSAGRIQSMREMKSAAFSGVYELILKYLLAFSDEPRKFVRILPDGTEQQECWNKYMFLDRDKNGEIYYRDDFTFNCDAASTLTTNRVQMWQETQDKFVQGAFGAPNDPRTLKLFWNTMDALQYPLATIALAGIKESEQHLPFEVEQAIMQNPQIMAMIQQMLSGQTENRGGARPNSGPQGNGATHAANVERTNERNRAQNRDVAAFSAQSGQTMKQGGAPNAGTQ